MIGGVSMKVYRDYSEIIMIDDMGRVTIPDVIRREMRIKKNQLLRIYTARVQDKDCICITTIDE